jgi:hypothetical protein
VVEEAPVEAHVVEEATPVVTEEVDPNRPARRKKK